MGQCHYCINCGLCKGELPKPFYVSRCVKCGKKNERGQKTCALCGASLILKPGISNTIESGHNH